jgi:plastocyanin
MSLTKTMRSALVAAGLATATATILVGAVLPGSAQTAPLARQANANAVSIENFTFMPQTLTVKAGTTVTWTNKDDIPHGIASENNAFARSKALDTDDATRSRLPSPAPTSISVTFIRT